MIERLTLSVLFGYAGHQLKGPTAQLFPSDGLNRLMSYGEGSLIILAAFVLLAYRNMDKAYRERAVTDLILAMFGVGLGTLLANVWDALYGGRE